MAEVKPFDFKQNVSILKSTGKRAKNLRQMREVIAAVGDASIFHHTCQYFLKGHILEYTSDFAQWAGESLEERALAEQISSVDPYAFSDIAALREELLRVIDDYLGQFPEPREAMAGDEFYFNETVTIIFSVGMKAANLSEFLFAIKYIDSASLYYHFYEARMRLGGGGDDFSEWCTETLGKKDLADRIRGIDPFMHTIEGIRGRIIEAVEEEVRRDMEGIGVPS